MSSVQRANELRISEEDLKIRLIFFSLGKLISQL